MANGTVHKLGTLYVGGAKKPFPTKPWQISSTPNGASGVGNIHNYNNGTSAVEIKDTDADDAYQLRWIEVNDGDDKLLICDRNILVNITWDRLNELGFCKKKGAGKTVTIDGQQYELFMLTGGNSETSTSDDWGRYIVNAGKFTGLPTPTSADNDNSLASADYTSAHNKVWNWAGCYSWCQNTYNSDYRALRGYSGARYWYDNGPYNYYDNYGWRPALRVLNAAPQITPASKSIGEINKPQNIEYSISDADGEQFNVVVKVDGTQKESYANQTDKSYTFQMSEYWDSLGLGAHTVEISATDINNATTTEKYTFTRVNTDPTITPTSSVLGDIKLPQDISYTINDADDDSLTVIVSVDDVEKERYENQTNSVRTFNMSNYWSNLSLGAHTVKITVTDIWGVTASATYTFVKKNGPAESPIVVSPLTGERRESDFYVEFTVGEDAEGDAQSIKIQAADDQGFSKNVEEFAEMEKQSGETWSLVEKATNEDVGCKFRIKVTGMSGEKYIRAVAIDDGSGLPSNSTVVKVSIGTVLEVQTKPAATADRTQKIIVLLDLVADEKITKEIQVCNNANDEVPTWEKYSPDAAGNHTFTNAEKTAEDWAVAAKIKITANDSTGEISLRAIGMGVL